jgi:hypothetical protein
MFEDTRQLFNTPQGPVFKLPVLVTFAHEDSSDAKLAQRKYFHPMAVLLLSLESAAVRYTNGRLWFHVFGERQQALVH